MDCLSGFHHEYVGGITIRAVAPSSDKRHVTSSELPSLDSLGYRGTALNTPLADRAEVTTYVQRNERDLTIHVRVPPGSSTPLEASIHHS